MGCKSEKIKDPLKITRLFLLLLLYSLEGMLKCKSN